MKNNELIRILSTGTKILSYYKDKDLLFALDDILKMCQEKKELQEQKSLSTDKVLKSEYNNESYQIKSSLEAVNCNNFLVQSESMSQLEIKNFLEDKGNFPNIESLKALATTMGIKSQSRVSRNNIVHSILMLIERKRIHKSISARHDSATRSKP